MKKPPVARRRRRLATGDFYLGRHLNVPERGCQPAKNRGVLNPNGRFGQFFIFLNGETVGHTRDVITNDAAERL